jgi:hypothetical protein
VSLPADALAPLYNALPRNGHLRRLECALDSISADVAHSVLLPALRANTSLRSVRALTEEHHGGGGAHASQDPAVATLVRAAEAAVAAHHADDDHEYA